MSITQSLGNQEDKIRHEALLMATEKAVLDHSGTRSPASRGGGLGSWNTDYACGMSIV